MLNLIDFIEKKRDGGRHTRAEFRELISLVMAGKAPDYQLAAWLMAAYLNGLDADETMYFTEALANSGSRHVFPEELHVVDKHSTGGVGDKATIVLLPLAASCGARISKLSGPGLGVTGGTVDKLESIPGMRMHLTPEEFVAQIRSIGCAVSGHSKELAPAEGVFYKLRDVTGTVPSIPLITSSIIGKKLAGGASGYVFDVKCGSGAFMRDRQSAEALARSLTGVSRKLGKRAVAVVTDMEQPLGEWVGNAAEIYEAVEVLSGRGPDETRRLCVTLCAQMLAVSGIADAQTGAAMAERALDDGSALRKFAEIVSSQGGDTAVTERPLEVLPRAKYRCEIKSDRAGYVARLDALSVGEALRELGGGRMKLDDKIDASAAVRVPHKIGSRVDSGDTIFELYCSDESKLDAAQARVAGAFQIADAAEPRKLIIETIS